MRNVILLLIILTGYGCDNHDSLYSVLSKERLPYLKKSKMIQISSYDTSGGNNDRINIHKDKTATIAEMEGPGVITRIWITIDSRDPHFLRRILLRMYWDDEENPSVEVPVGDFFGCGFEYKHHISEYVGMSSGGYYCYFSMPFNKKARIEVVNQTGQEIYAFYFQINYHRLENSFTNDIAYFHANWCRDIRTDYKDNYTVLEAKGRGHFVGLNMSMQPYERSLWYLEGDEMVYVDGEKFPSIYGTGTEDYFTAGWYFKNGTFNAPYHGLIVKDDSLGRISAYRHHIPDPIPFKKSIKFTIEHGHKNEEICDFSSTAYWYQTEPHKKYDPILKSTLRIPLRVVVPNGLVEAEGLHVEGKIKYHIEDMSGFGPEWSGLKQIKIGPGQKGDSFNITIPDAIEKSYNVDLYFTKGPDYGKIDVFYKGKKVTGFNGYYEQVYPGGKITLNNLKPEVGQLDINFVISGKDDKSTGFALGLDGFKLNPVREFIPEWYVIGPFPNERDSDILRYGLDTVYPPEQEINLTKTYFGADSQQVKWKKYKTPELGYFTLWDKCKPYEFVVCYTLTYIYSAQEQSVPLLIGSDDGSKVFLNDEELYRFLEVRIAAPDQDRVELNLKKGWNKLLLKIENNFGGYAFFARIMDANSNLRYSPDKK